MEGGIIMKLYAIYNKQLANIGFMTDERNFVPQNDEQWLTIEHSHDFLPIMLEHVTEQELPYILAKMGHDTKKFLKYTNRFIFDEEMFRLILETKPEVIELRKHICKVMLNETAWYVQQNQEFGVPVPADIAAQRLEWFTYLQNH